jgi:lincosamide nucleotidyltransferase A/C/D/E
MVEHSSSSAFDTNRRNRVDQLRATLTRLHLIGMAHFVDRWIRRLLFAGLKSLRSLSRVPLVGPGLDPLLARVDRHNRLNFELTELLRLCAALSDEHLPYWVAGGWGLDALVGCQTRRHRDLDLVVHPFRENLPKVAALLTSLGYERKTPLGGTLWFPDAEVYVDDRGHDVQVLNINWGIVTTVGMLLSPVGTAESESTDERNPVMQLLLEQCTSTGILDGVSIPTLSVTAQQLFHLGYPRRPEEPHAEDVIRLISMGQDGWINPLGQNGAPLSSKESRKPSTLLLIPIFAFPPDLWKLCRLYHNNLHVPPHVTLAIPFRPLESVTAEVVQQLTRFFEETLAFDFELNHVRWFGTNVVYLEPSNAESFRSITERLQRMFPDFHPYDGAFDSVIPHVTLSEHGTLADRRIMGQQAPKYTPITARASHVWLMSNEREPDEWSIVKVFHLGPPPLARPHDRGSQAT